jgi:hypothetical protein
MPSIAPSVRAHETDDALDPVHDRPLVQIAILLDTSSSMNGLIDQAKSQLWKIVNELSCARRKGRVPVLQVALYEYGKSGLSQSSGWIRMIQPFTTDLDTISEQLFSLETNGGQEYCGWVIRDAVKQLSWNESSDVYKAIFIAGNEPFTQGPVPYRDACQAAIENGIIVNTIHCGSMDAGQKGRWDEGALLAEGKFMTIDHNRVVAHRRCPQDDEIIRLGRRLNDTYLPYGREGTTGRMKQLDQDANSSELAAQGSLLNRSLFKATSVYCNDHWDLVDACQAGKVAVGEVPAAQLPELMRRMNVEERSAYIGEKAKERADIQAKIKELENERNRYLAEEFKQEDGGRNTLDEVMIGAIREQVRRKDLTFEK